MKFENSPNLRAKLEQEMNSAFKGYTELFGLTPADLQNKRILDAAAGSGFFVQYIREKLNNDKAFALDISQRRNDKPDWYICQDLQETFLPGNSFDLITAKHVFPMFIQPEYPAVQYGIEMDYKIFLSEMLRILDSKGVLMFDIQTPEDIENMTRDSEEDKEGIRKRAENAQQAIKFIEALDPIKYKIEFVNNKRQVVKITKK